MPERKILVVDDEEELLGLIDKSLTMEGYDVTTVTTAGYITAALTLRTYAMSCCSVTSRLASASLPTSNALVCLSFFLPISMSNCSPVTSC